MDKTSTPLTAPQRAKQAMTPRKATVDFVRQFARIYMSVSKMPGIVLN